MSRLIISDGFLQIMMVRLAIFNFSTNFTNEQHSLSEDWDLKKFLTVDLEKDTVNVLKLRTLKNNYFSRCS